MSNTSKIDPYLFSVPWKQLEMEQQAWPVGSFERARS